jgi:hypothetical protein
MIVANNLSRITSHGFTLFPSAFRRSDSFSFLTTVSSLDVLDALFVKDLYITSSIISSSMD